MPRASARGEVKETVGHEKSRNFRRGFSQAWQDSNLQPPVLEFGVLRPVLSLLAPFCPFLYRLSDPFVPFCPV